MTKERLYKYCSLQRQIKLIEERYKGVSFLSGVDTTKPSVQSGKNSDTTADNAIKLINVNEYELKDYKALVQEYCELNKFIYGIQDEETKEIFKRRFIYEEEYWQISNEVHLSIRAIHKRIDNYIKKQ